jgi:hypothetical protein
MLAALESLLRDRKLDVTLTSLGPAGEPVALVKDNARAAPTGVAALDTALGGGLRRGQLSEITGAASTGRTTLVVAALAAATARGEAAALVDTSDTFDPASAAARGVALAQLLWVRASAPLSDGERAPSDQSPSDQSPSDQSPSDQRMTRAVKACSLILRAGGFGLVVFDLADVAPAALRRLPATTWMRLARSVEGSETVALIVGAEHLARSAAGVTIACESAAAEWQGATERARLFTGIAATPRVVGGRR